MKACVILVIFLCASCGGKPEKQNTSVALRQDLIASAQESALWMTLTDFQNTGKLARLDLKTGLLNSDVRNVSADTVLASDDLHGETRGLFLINRGKNDSISILEGAAGAERAQRILRPGSNPQHAARDFFGRIWVVSYDTNDVLVFSPDLSVEERRIDYATFVTDPVDGLVELFQIFRLDEGREMLVGAQMMQRTGSIWFPHEKSHFTRFDSERLVAIEKQEVLASNFVGICGHTRATLSFYGAGALSPERNRSATRDGFGLPFRILGFDCRTEPTLIAWYPDQHRSCIHFNGRDVHCEQTSPPARGYVFNKIIRLGNLIFVSNILGGNSELWIFTLDGVLREKIGLPMMVQSLSRGP